MYEQFFLNGIKKLIKINKCKQIKEIKFKQIINQQIKTKKASAISKKNI